MSTLTQRSIIDNLQPVHAGIETHEDYLAAVYLLQQAAEELTTVLAEYSADLSKHDVSVASIASEQMQFLLRAVAEAEETVVDYEDRIRQAALRELDLNS